MDGTVLLRSLDDRRDLGRRWWTLYGIGMLLLAVAFGCFIVLERGVMVGLPLAGTAHAVAIGLCYGLLCFVFLTQGRGDRRMGYLILGATFGFSGLIWAWYPYFFPNGLAYSVPSSPVVGDGDSAAVLYVINRWAVLLGITVGGVVIARVTGTTSSARPRVAAVVAWTATAVGLVLGWAAIGAPGFPVSIVSGHLSAGARTLDTISVVAWGAVAVPLLARTCRSGSFVSRWLLTVAILGLLEAAATPFAPRYSANWLAITWLSLIGSLVLLFALLEQMDRILRSRAAAADFDELTGALSRSAFVHAIAEHLAAPPSARAGSGVLWIDLDQFRHMNAQAGSAAGDAFLRASFARLRDFVPGDDRVARIGGDEFALIVRAHSPMDLLTCGAQVVESMGRPLDVPDAQLMSTVSVGCAWIDDSVDSAEEVLRRAHAAMLAAKGSGGDTAEVYSPALDELAESEMQWRHRIAVAIREESFENAYQPVFDTRTGHVVAVEALIRLVDESPPVTAGEFIAYAEASGQVVAIGRIGLRRLVNDLPQLLASSTLPPLRVSFNLSVPQLVDPVLIGMLLQPPLHPLAERLIVEVTESFELSASMIAHENLLRLSRAGYRIAIDDFGAGFSNFVQLEEIGRHVIKLDRSLIVRAGTGEPSSLTVLSAALAVARSLASEVLAEGVETAAEAEIVEQLGIHLVQGFRFAHPMMLPEVLQFIRIRNAEAEDRVDA